MHFTIPLFDVVDVVPGAVDLEDLPVRLQEEIDLEEVIDNLLLFVLDLDYVEERLELFLEPGLGALAEGFVVVNVKVRTGEVFVCVEAPQQQSVVSVDSVWLLIFDEVGEQRGLVMREENKECIEVFVEI